MGLFGRGKQPESQYSQQRPPGASRGALDWLRRLGGWLGPRASAGTTARAGITGERAAAGPRDIVFPWFLPYFDDKTGETAEMRAAYRMMFADPNVKAALLGKLLAVGALDLKVLPADKKNPTDRHVAKFVEYNLRQRVTGGIPGVAWSILGAGLIDGYSVCEKVFAPEERGRYRDQIILKDLKPKDTGNDVILLTDEYRNVVGVQGLRYNSGETFSPSSFVIFKHLPLFQSPTGMSDLRAVYSRYWMLDTVLKLRAIGLEKRSMPLLVGTYADETVQPSLEKALRLAKSQYWLAVPEGARVEALNIAGSSQAEFKSAIEDLKHDIFLGIAGAILQALEGAQDSERGNSQVHRSTADLFIWYLSSCVESLLNDRDDGLIKDLVDLNFVVADYPQAKLSAVDVNELIQEIQIDTGLSALGLDLSKDELYERYSRTPPEDPDDVLKPQQPQQGGGGGGLDGLFGGGPKPPRAPQPPTPGDDRPFEEFCQEGENKGKPGPCPDKAEDSSGSATATQDAPGFAARTLAALHPRSILSATKAAAQAVRHPAETIAAVKSKAVDRFHQLQERYGTAGAVAIAGAYAGYYAAAAVQPQIMLFVPSPSAVLLGSAEAIRYGLSKVRGHAEFADADMLQAALDFIEEMAEAAGEEPPDVDERLLSQVLDTLLAHGSDDLESFAEWRGSWHDHAGWGSLSDEDWESFAAEEWQPYTGPRGGKGWKKGDRIVYSATKPGEAQAARQKAAPAKKPVAKPAPQKKPEPKPAEKPKEKPAPTAAQKALLTVASVTAHAHEVLKAPTPEGVLQLVTNLIALKKMDMRQVVSALGVGKGGTKSDLAKKVHEVVTRKLTGEGAAGGQSSTGTPAQAATPKGAPAVATPAQAKAKPTAKPKAQKPGREPERRAPTAEQLQTGIEQEAAALAAQHKGMVPVHELRARLEAKHGTDPATGVGRKGFDNAILDLWRAGKVDLTNLSDLSGLTPEQMASTIPASPGVPGQEHQRIAYVTPKQPKAKATPKPEAAPARPAGAARTQRATTLPTVAARPYQYPGVPAIHTVTHDPDHPVVQMDPSQLVTTQTWLDSDKESRMKGPLRQDRPVVVVHFGGKYYLEEGNHRAAHALATGQKVPAKVIEGRPKAGAQPEAKPAAKKPKAEVPAAAADPLAGHPFAGKSPREMLADLERDAKNTTTDSNPRGYDTKGYPPGVDGPRLERAVTSAAVEHVRKNPFDRPTVKGLFEKARANQPNLSLHDFQSALVKMQADGKVTLHPYTQALGRVDPADLPYMTPLDREAKFYVGVGPKVEAAAPPEHQSAVLEAVKALDRDRINMVQLPALRAELGKRGLSREQQDAAIHALRKAGVLTANALEGRHGMTPQEREAVIDDGNEKLMGSVSLRKPQ
jgi:hypothetical protein